MKILILTLVLLGVTSCAHQDIAKSSPPIGEHKSVVVETYGSPDRSWRAESKDFWLYEIGLDDRKILVFDHGKLESVRNAQTQNDILELEAELKKLAPKKTDKFEDL